MTNRMLGSLATSVIFVAALATTTAIAQPTDPHQEGMGPHPQGMHHHGMMDWDAMDTNHDGKISAAEHAAYAKAMFDKMDRNHDGVITRDEIHAHMEAMMKEHRAKMFDRMDTNHDGMISRDEMEAAMREMHGMRGMRGEHMMGEDEMMMGDDSMSPPPPAR